jgi:ATP-dependent 26S proteasome regulatory subunit
MAPTRRASIAALGLGRNIDELAEQQERIKQLQVTRNDDPRTALAKNERQRALIDRAFESIKALLAAKATATQIAIYDGEAESLGDTDRARVIVADRYMNVALAVGISNSDLTRGQCVEIAPDASMITAAHAGVPTDGRVVPVVAVLPVSADHDQTQVIEVEEGAGDRGRCRVRVSGFMEGCPLQEGDLVRVNGCYAYELVKDRATQRAEFLHEVRIEPTQHVSFSDVMGQPEAVDELRLAVDRLVDPARYGGLEHLPNAVYLLTGQPGNGKSLLFAATATELVARLGDRVKICLIRASALKDAYVGNSEKNARVIFDQAQYDYRERGIRTLIGFEEFEAVGMQRGALTDNTGVSHGITSTLLTYLDDALTKLEGMLVLVMTNYEDLLDAALRRVGRTGSNRLVIRRLNDTALLEILTAKLSNGAAKLLDGAPVEEYAAAVQAALSHTYAHVVVGNEKVAALGRHLASGAVATGCIGAALSRLHRHQLLARERGLETPYQHLSPALLYYGARRTLSTVAATHAGVENLRQARAMLAGDLVHENDLKSMSELRVVPQSEFVTPESYHLKGMEALE